MMNRWGRWSVLCVVGSSLAIASNNETASVPLILSSPFILLLLAIAVAPLIDKEWWEKHYPKVAIPLGLFTALYYIAVLGAWGRVWESLHDYISFIILIGSLYIVSGGILVTVKGKSTPLNNTVMLAVGAVLANLVGTTGASMLLIRPYLKVNRYRIKPYHVVFFIFLVSNIGGLLTPIGDPPLFLGYLKGIPFFWVTEHLAVYWLAAVAFLLLVFYVRDRQDFRKRSEAVQERVEKEGEEPRVRGLSNIGFLLAILAGVFITAPMFLREAIMVAAAVGSYYTTDREIHRRNDFNFHPVTEVAVLFFGIFLSMIPALDWLAFHSAELGIASDGQFYWATGVLSAFLDNAPTYLNFLTVAFGIYGVDGASAAAVIGFAADHARTLEAISVAAVFFGAATYIGNGPNFMVKAIAEQNGVAMPSFGRYIIRYTVPVLVPLFLAVWFVSFRY